MRSHLLALRIDQRKRMRAEFRRKGFVVVSSCVSFEEIDGMRRSFDRLVRQAVSGLVEDAHFVTSERTGDRCFAYLSHVLEKSTMMRILLAHPGLASVVTLLLGAQYVSTSEFLVYKETDDAWHVRWHRDISQSPQVPAPGASFSSACPSTRRRRATAYG